MTIVISYYVFEITIYNSNQGNTNEDEDSFVVEYLENHFSNSLEDYFFNLGVPINVVECDIYLGSITMFLVLSLSSGLVSSIPSTILLYPKYKAGIKELSNDIKKFFGKFNIKKRVINIILSILSRDL